MSDSPNPPLAPRRPTVLEKHGERRIDDWYWLRQRENPEVKAYLEAENAYTKAMLPNAEAVTEALYQEMLARIKETDDSVPVREHGFYYYHRTVQGLQYPIHCRKRGSLEAPEEILFDENEYAKGREYFDLGALEPSPSHRLLAYAIDLAGDEKFTVRFRDLEGQLTFAEEIPGTSGHLAFATDEILFYTQLDDAHRPYRVMRHRLGTAPNEDVEVYRDDDERYFVGVSRSRSGAYVFVESASKVTSEVSLVACSDPLAKPKLVEPRREKIEYSLEHAGDRFLIHTNDGAVNFQVMEAPLTDPSRTQWREHVPHRDDVYITGVDAFREHVVYSERKLGLPRIVIEEIATRARHVVEIPEPTYQLSLGQNPEYDTRELRFAYSSFITPRSVFDYDMTTRQRTLKKRQEVLGGYDPTRYRSERIFATSRDGTQVPISIVYRDDFVKDGTQPLLLWGYGSYGINYDPQFSSDRFTLLDRGIAIAIAHPRGGGEMGRRWYDDGKWLKKRNTFDDFIACAEKLIAERFTSSNRLLISGGSAGGMLMGVVLNERPELFHAALAQVPFVDVLTSMLDSDLPLTTAEFEEWGNPEDPEYYRVIRSYSPYDNVLPQRFPHLLVTAGLNDPRVPYWEPAKWVAKLRVTKQDSNVLLLKTNMGAGHQGASGRYDFLKERAFEYAFLLDRVGRLEHRVSGA